MWLLWNKCLQFLLCLASEFFSAIYDLRWLLLDEFGELDFVSNLVELGFGLLPSFFGMVFVVGGGLQ